MTTTPSRPLDRIPTWLLIAAGIATITLSGNRLAIPLLGWIAPIPLLLATTRLRGWRGRAILLGATILAFTASASKVVSAPMPPWFGVMFGVPLGLVMFAALIGWDAVRRRLGPVWAIYAFVALSVLADYATAELSPAGDWGAYLVNSQLDNLPLLQLASLGGLGLITLVMAWPIGAATSLLFDRRRAAPHLAAAIAAVVAAHAWGAWRLDTLALGPTVTVGAVTVDLPDPLTEYDQLRGNVDVLFARSELAVQRGARLVIWNEVATLIDPAEEAGLHARGAAFARAHHVDLVMAYGVMLAKDPISLENKYEWLGPEGETVETYLKHFIVPGDPNVAGDAPLRVLDRPWGKAAGAICYDYDAPWIARAHARGGAGVIALPASDWRGIDPYHTQMARVRAIEGGMSVVRSVRAATSMAFDPYGRVRASMSAWESDDHVMIATVPTTHVDTLYTRLGNWPAGLALAGLLAMVALAVVRIVRPSHSLA